MKPVRRGRSNPDLFRERLDAIIDMRHGLVRLAGLMPWSAFDETFGKFFKPIGRPAKPTRLMVGLQYLKHVYNLSDEEVVEVVCISKGKAHKRYEFGCKVGIAATNREGLFIAAMAFEGNPYDGHTLNATAAKTEEMTGVAIQCLYADKGYRGHDYDGKAKVMISDNKRGLTPTMKRELKRRSAIEQRTTAGLGETISSARPAIRSTRSSPQPDTTSGSSLRASRTVLHDSSALSYGC